MNIEYLDKMLPILENIDKQSDVIKKAAQVCSEVISNGKLVHVFGSGFSAIAVQDIFPRYGTNLGYHPITDEKLIWNNVKTLDDVKELLKLEKQEDYADSVLDKYNLQAGEAMIIFSHGGLNNAPIDAALYAKEKGLTVIVISSLDNYKYGRKSTHSSKKRLYDVADIFIDNCCPLCDGLIELEGYPSKVGASSTVGALLAGQSLVSETAKLLNEKGYKIYTMETSNVETCPKDWSPYVYNKYLELLEKNK